MVLFFFMMVFMDTTATIPTGAMAERWAWKNFCLYGLWVALPYCLYANWVWGGGWLAQGGINWGLGHGAVDFAGSGVVHAMGGVIALAGAMVIGPRIGKYDSQGKPKAMPGHNVPMVDARHVHPGFRLVRFQSGFDPCRHRPAHQLRRREHDACQHRRALAAMVTLMMKGLKPDPTMMCNGMLAGLVAITAPCAFVDPWAAAVIGLVAGWLVVVSVFFWEARGVDDPVGAISVHGVNGFGACFPSAFSPPANTVPAGTAWCVKGWSRPTARTACAVFSTATSRSSSCSRSMRGTVAVFGFVMAYVWFKISDLITPIRVSKETRSKVSTVRRWVSWVIQTSNSIQGSRIVE